MRTKISVTVNGEEREVEVDNRTLLVDMLRNQLNLTGTHLGCGTGTCGACTVQLGKRTAKSCCVLAVEADGEHITTIEGLSTPNSLHPVQSAFVENHGLQCGFCTPGMVLSAIQLLEDNPNPTESEIRDGIAGNLCRCTGYVNIVKSIEAVATEFVNAAEH